MFVFHLISGYRGSGKDSFYKNIIGQNDYKYFVFKNPESEYVVLEDYEIITQIGLADAVKKLVNEELKIKFDLEACPHLELQAKNHLYFYDHSLNDYVPLRHYYIQKGMAMRDIDPDFWCIKTLEHLKEKYVNHETTNIHVFITDYRFYNEKEFFEKHGKVITYRIFRKEADNNDKSIISEHSLDECITDYLVLSDYNDLPHVRRKFSQYNNHI